MRISGFVRRRGSADGVNVVMWRTMGAAATLSLLWVFHSVSLAVAAPSCPNEQLRSGYSAHLSDCRAYELVTTKGSPAPRPPLYRVALIEPYLLPEGNGNVQSASDGGRIAYESEENNTQSSGLIYLATRGKDGWSTEGMIPPQSVENSFCVVTDTIAGWASDLSKGVLTDGYAVGSFGEPVDCGRDEPELVAGEPRVGNLFVHDLQTGEYQLVDVTPPSVVPTEAIFDGGSADMSHIVFNEDAQLTPNAPTGDEVYVWSAGKVYLLTILPDGQAVEGQLAGAIPNKQPLRNPPWQTGYFSHAVSADGSRIFFEADGNLYVRENGSREEEATQECATQISACTVEVDAAEVGALGSSGGGTFKWASADGSRVFFTDESRLTKDSTAAPGEPDLYEYEVNRETGKAGTLTDLTVAEAGAHADVLGVSGASEDGSYVYFVADGVLPESGENSRHATAQAGQPNLYVHHGEATDYIATLNGQSTDVCDWTAVCLTARVSANGLFVAFDSVAELTGYDNTPATPFSCATSLGGGEQEGAPCIEIFRYSISSGSLECASCGASGVHPTASATIRLPAPTSFFRAPAEYLAHNVSDAGQVFFDTENPLLASNGKSDVYEYEDGGLHLISSGTSDEGSYFYDATPDGSNAFFVTAQALLPQDTSAAYAIYDARVGGGFPYVAPPAPCGGDDCKGAIAEAPVFQTPASASFAGAGNLPAVRAKSTPKRLTRSQLLARALRACRRDRNRRKRRVCERKARNRYGVRPNRARHGHRGAK